MNARECLCARVLRSPEIAAALEPGQWDLLIRQARRADLLAKLAHLLDAAGIWQRIPEQPRQHLEAERMVAGRRAEALLIELDHLRDALIELGCPVILLKGAAYLAAGLPPSRGRQFSDIDLLVPQAFIDRAELALKFRGWSSAYHSDYDHRYYRKWMHEIPPLRHLTRSSVVDLHHAILPPTARLQTPPVPLFEAAVPLSGDPLLCVLSPADMVLHSATHLFHEGEFPHGLRDIVDLDALLRHFDEAPGFWDELAKRAQRLNLTRPLFYALRYTRRVLDTPVPIHMQDIDRTLVPRLMDSLFDRALSPDHHSCDDRLTPWARGFLYVRGHWLRMPLHLLIPHLIRKALRLGTEQTPPKKIDTAAMRH